MTPRHAILATLVVLAIATIFALLWRFQGVVFTFVVAIMLHIAVKPVVERLRLRGVRNEAGILLVYGLVFAVMAVFLALVLPFLLEQIGMILGRLPDYYNDFRLGMLNSDNESLSTIARSLPADFSRLPFFNATTSQTEQAPSDVLRAFINTVVIFAAIFLMAFYWTLDGERILLGLLLRLPEEKREGTRELIAEMESKVGAFYRGQIVLCTFVGALSTIVYVAIGLPYAFLLGLLAFIFEAVPMIGPALGAVPAVIIALALAPEKAVLVIVATLIIQQIENNLLVPRVMDKAVGVNPIVSIIAITAFSVAFGLVGALLAIPLAAIIQIMLNRVLFQAPAAAVMAEAVVAPSNDLVGDLQQTAGRDKLALLRVEARELAEDVRKTLRDTASADGVSNEQDEQIEDMIEAVAMDLDVLLAEQESPLRDEASSAPMQPQPGLVQ